MRTLELTHKEIEHIEFALKRMYKNQLEYAQNLEDTNIKKIVIDNASKYAFLLNDIAGGEKDV